VRPRTFRDPNADLCKAGETRAVGNLFEVSVRKVGMEVRITDRVELGAEPVDPASMGWQLAGQRWFPLGPGNRRSASRHDRKRYRCTADIRPPDDS